MNPTPQVYILKVALMRAKSIWRKIAIREDQTLDDLHEAIFVAFDRYDEHLYSFYTPLQKTKSIRKIYESPEYTVPIDMNNSEAKNAAKTTLKELNLQPKQVFYYLFDFGDCWWHEITFDSVRRADRKKYPVIVATRGESPPQYDDEEDYEDYEDSDEE